MKITFLSSRERTPESQYLVIKRQEALRADGISGLPQAVKDQFDILLFPPHLAALSLENVLSDVYAIERADGLVDFVGRITGETIEKNDLSLPKETLILVEFNPKDSVQEVQGYAVVEVGKNGNPRIFTFRTLRSNDNPHFSYSRLWVLQNYCMKVVGYPLSSGSPTRVKNLDGTPKPREEYEAGHHIWKWFVDRKLAFDTGKDEDRFMFHHVPPQPKS